MWAESEGAPVVIVIVIFVVIVIVAVIMLACTAFKCCRHHDMIDWFIGQLTNQ